MPKSIFYSSIRSPHCLKIGMILTEKQIPFERVEIDLRAKQQKTDAFLAINPAGQVPVYVDDYGTHADSLIIMQHLDQLVPDPPRLFPDDAQQLQTILNWIELSSTRARDVSHELYWQLIEPPDDGTDWETVNALKSEGIAILTKMETDLSNAEYICGQLSAADFALLPWIHGYRRFDLPAAGSMPHVEAWIERIIERPSFAANYQQVGRPF